MLPTRRLKMVRCTPAMLVQLLQPGAHKIVGNAIPQTALVYGASYDLERDMFQIVIWDESFEEVDEGKLIPWHPASQILDIPLDTPEQPTTIANRR